MPQGISGLLRKRGHPQKRGKLTCQKALLPAALCTGFADLWVKISKFYMRPGGIPVISIIASESFIRIARLRESLCLFPNPFILPARLATSC